MSKVANENLNYNIAMYSKEQDFLRYLRMQARSAFVKRMYAKVIEPIACDEVIFIPMFDGVNLTAKQVAKYENPDYEIPARDNITPLIKKSIKSQNIDFFTDARQHNERHSVQVRVLCSKRLAFESKEVRLQGKSARCCPPMCCGSGGNQSQFVLQSAAQQNLKNKVEKVVLHFHGGAFVCMSSYQHSSYTRQWANMLKEDNAVVFSVDYRLAPEYPFPIPFSDCFQVYCWIVT